MTPTRILIVEDEVLIAEHIKDYLISLGAGTEIMLTYDIKTAAEALHSFKPELALLDMQLENPIDGIELSSLIDKTYKIPYIFITANADTMMVKEALQTNAAAYLTKPFKKADLFAAVKIALKSKEPAKEENLVVRDSGSTLFIPVNEIIYIESNGNYIDIHTKKQKIISRQSLEWAEEQLPEHLFLRVHRSFIINVSAVSKSNSKTVYIGEIEIAVSRTYAAKLNERLKK
jgi:DNA-binding LytR/AlgR family response regulator